MRQPAFSFQWKPLAQPVVPKGEFWPPRDWQKRAFKDLKSAYNAIINAPMGSGKTWLMCLLSAYKMKKHSNLRTLIAVPQTIIGSGFADAKLLMPDNSKLHWFAQHNLCQESPTEGTVQYVINWLQNTPAFFQDRILVCTHATIVAVYKRLKATNQRKLLHDLICWIDEAHHLKNAEIEGFEDSVVSNSIGELATYLLRYGKNVHLGLSTACFFRGDRLSLLTPKMRDKFVPFSLPYDEYMESMQYLKSFSFDFLLCGPDYLKAVSEVIKDKHKDIIYIPHPISRHSMGDKYAEAEQIIECYREIHKGKRIDSDGLTVLRKKLGEFKILNLVDEDRRKKKKDYVCKLQSQEATRDDLDAIIALGMFKEGANWIWADRSIIVGPRISLVDVIQMVGRLFRDAEGKEHVRVVQLLPFSIDQTDEKKLRENLNNYLKAINASLVLEDVLNPVKIKVPKGKKKKGMKHKKLDWLSEVLPDAEKQISLREDVRDKLMEIAVVNNAEGDVTFLWDEYQKALPEILSEFGVVEHIKEVGQQIWAGFARRTLQMQGIDVSDIDFDILRNADPLGFLTRYTSSCNVTTLQQLRGKIRVRQAKHNKKILLEMAKSGEPRPNKYHHPLGNSLVSYTCSGADSYDAEFKNHLHSIRLDWFENSATKRQNLIIELAKSGKPRPPQRSKLGMSLAGYMVKGSKTYNHQFVTQIRQLRPDWFKRKTSPIKPVLIEMAMNGASRPPRNTREGRILGSFTRPSSPQCDEKFHLRLKQLRPDWFDKSNEYKKELIKMAKNKEHRPSRHRPPKTLGNCLCNYTSRSGKSYDAEFDKKIRALAPSWFEKTKNKKLQLMQIAELNQPRPKSKYPLYKALGHYTSVKSTSYDAKFDKEIRLLRPDWFKR